MKMDCKILIIDGDEKFIIRMKRLFGSRNGKVFFHDTGEKGLEAIVQNKPDIVLVSVKLADMTAEELFTRYLMDCPNPAQSVPFVVLTGRETFDKACLYSLGFSGCLSHPVKTDQLMACIDDVLLNHRLKKEELCAWETIREAKDFLEKLVESSVDSIVTTDNKGFVTYCNRACEEMLGYGFEDLVGKRVSEFLHHGSTELLRMTAFLRKRNRIQNYRTELVQCSGRKISVNLSVSTLKNGVGRVIGALSICKPAGGETCNEYNAKKSDRISGIVETAVAVNHEINNPLVPILGNAQYLLQDDKIVDEDIKRRLRVITSNALRIRNVTQKLARISHPVTKEYLKGTRMLDIDASN